jgi:hypothetical protein
MIILAIDMMIEMNSAILKLDISKISPIILSVSMSVIALMTNKKNPNVKIVNGNVKITSNGRTKTFKMDNKKLAATAAPKPVMWNESWKNPAKAINNIALIRILMSHRMIIWPPSLE